MIFVILGTQKFQLNRLLRLLDEYIEEGKIQDEIVAQIGNSTYIPRHYKYYKFLDKQQFDGFVKRADLVITHSGVGSIITAINAGKPVIVFPRLAKYKEHIDDHQCDIANAFSKKKYVLCCNEDDDLYEVIKKSNYTEFEHYVSQRTRIVNIIDEFLKNN